VAQTFPSAFASGQALSAAFDFGFSQLPTVRVCGQGDSTIREVFASLSGVVAPCFSRAGMPALHTTPGLSTPRSLPQAEGNASVEMTISGEANAEGNARARCQNQPAVRVSVTRSCDTFHKGGRFAGLNFCCFSP